MGIGNSGLRFPCVCVCVCVCVGGVGIPRVVGAVGIWGVGILKGAVIWGVRY